MSLLLHAQLESVHYGGRAVLRDVNLRVSPGRWTAIVGPNGAGKSTLLRAMAGLVHGHGTVQLQGKPLSAWPAKERGRAMAWLGQAESGADDLQAQDVVMLGRLPHQAWLAAPSEADWAVVQEAMLRTHCWAWRDRPLGQLSGGERQRVLLARVLAVQAPVVLMDEPLAHLDPPHQADWLDIVRQLRHQGVTVVSVLHELNLALQADELAVMADGQLRYHGPCEDARAEQALVSVFDHRIRVLTVDNHRVVMPCTPVVGATA